MLTNFLKSLLLVIFVGNLAMAEDLTALPDSKLPQRVTQLEQQLEIFKKTNTKASISASVNEINDLKQQVKQLSMQVKELQYQLDQAKIYNTEARLNSETNFEELDNKPGKTPLSEAIGDMPSDLARELTENNTVVSNMNSANTNPFADNVLDKEASEAKVVATAEELLKQRNFDEATNLLMTKIDTMHNPELALKANIMYGRALAGSGDLDQAASHMMTSFHRFNDQQDAPIVLLDLSKVLNAAKKASQACATLNKLERRYNNLDHGLVDEVTQARQSYGCSNFS
ncbi:MAG: hypothetical protein AAF153_01880 [Pseudomonadota bacterium]